MHPDENLIRAFVAPERQARLLALLDTPKRRRKLTSQLAHFRALDPRYASRLAAGVNNADEIAAALRQRGAPATCYVLSENPALDARELQLTDALAQVVGYGMGTFLSCIPGALAYFEGEDPGERYLLTRSRA